MKRFFQIVTKILSVTAPVATFMGPFFIPKYIASSFPHGSPMSWFGLALAVSGVITTNVALFKWGVIDRAYTHYAAVAYHEVFRRGQLLFRAYKWSIALGFCATVVGFFCDAAMPLLFYAVALPSCTVSFICLVPIGVAYLWMRRVARSYDGYISYTYEIFNTQTGTRESRQDVCHIREVDNLIMAACFDFLDNQRKYELIQNERLEKAAARAFYKATAAASKPQDDED